MYILIFMLYIRHWAKQSEGSLELQWSKNEIVSTSVQKLFAILILQKQSSLVDAYTVVQQFTVVLFLYLNDVFILFLIVPSLLHVTY